MNNSEQQACKKTKQLDSVCKVHTVKISCARAILYNRGFEAVDVIKNAPALAAVEVTMALDEDVEKQVEKEEERYAPGPRIEVGAVEVGEKEFKLTPMVFGEGDSVDEEVSATPFKTAVL